MIKKHVIGCSVLLLFMLVARTFIFSSLSDSTDISLFNHSTNKVVSSVVTPVNKTLSFANEVLPVGDPRIDYRMKKSLYAHSFDNLQTHKLHKKAAQWFPLIEPILQAYGIPEDFKYVPLVESGLQAGTSPRGASGFWQFMPGTARNYGLKVNDGVDERQNMRKSTVAACKYIKSMYSELKSWTLVAAAYNVGDVNLKRQMNKQNQDNYFKLKLNRETASYVYKLISMKEIIERPHLYGYARKPKVLIASAFKRTGKYVDPISGYDGAHSLKALQN